MLFRFIYLLFAFGLSYQLSADTDQKQNAKTPVTVGERYVVHSKILGEDRQIYVSLPWGHGAGGGYKKYPVLYVLDGNWLFESYAPTVRQLSNDITPHIPQMIVVGISNMQSRVRDATPTKTNIGYENVADEAWSSSGGGDAFLRFMKEELIPHVEENYHASSYRMLAGYSLNGLPVLNAFFHHRDMFSGYIAIDPSQWWDNYLPYRQAADVFGTETFDKQSFFFATSSELYAKEVFELADNPTNIGKILEAINPVGLNWRHKRYGDENHHTMQIIAFIDGLKFLFQGHKSNIATLYTSPDAIKGQYAKLSERLGHAFYPPEGATNSIGHILLNGLKKPRPDLAMQYFEMNAANYPKSPYVWSNLAQAHAVQGDKGQAESYYRKALKLVPDNAYIKRKLEELTEP